MRLEQLYDKWYAAKYRDVPISMQERIRNLSETFFLNEYRDMPVRLIGDEFALWYLQKLMERSARQNDRRDAVGILRDICGYAVRSKIIPYNPFLELRVPALETTRHHALSKEDIQLIMGLDPHVTEHNFFQVKLLTGTRTSECLGMCWEHVDFATGTIRICDQLQYFHTEDGKRELRLSGHLKNYKPRVIKPPAITFDRLRIRQEQQKCMKANCEDGSPSFIYTDDYNNPISPFRISEAFRNCIPMAKERGLRLHDLRITNATIEYRLTGDLEKVRKNLGHASSDVTMRYYIDIDYGWDKALADAIDAYYKDAGLWE